MCDCDAYTRCLADAISLRPEQRDNARKFCLEYYGSECEKKCPGIFDD